MESFIQSLESAVLINGHAIARINDCAAKTLDFAFLDDQERDIDFCISFDFDPIIGGFAITYIRIHCTQEACGIEKYGHRVKVYGRNIDCDLDLYSHLTWTHEFLIHCHTKEAPFVVLEDKEQTYYPIKC